MMVEIQWWDFKGPPRAIERDRTVHTPAAIRRVRTPGLEARVHAGGRGRRVGPHEGARAARRAASATTTSGSTTTWRPSRAANRRTCSSFQPCGAKTRSEAVRERRVCSSADPRRPRDGAVIGRVSILLEVPPLDTRPSSAAGTARRRLVMASMLVVVGLAVDGCRPGRRARETPGPRARNFVELLPASAQRTWN